MSTPHDTGIHIFGRPVGLALLVLYKCIWGALEVIAGLFVLFTYAIFARELVEDPQDLFVNWLLGHLGIAQAHQLGAVIVLLGGIKIALAIGLWYRSWRIRNIALVFFCAAALFASYELVYRLTPFRVGALGMDLFLLYYCWKVLPKHLRHGEVV
jgi:uncharacterized membrane protein